MSPLEDMLKGGDLRSTGKSNAVVLLIGSQQQFDTLFACLFHTERIVAMRAADAIEKITVNQPAYLQPHKKHIIGLCMKAEHIELKWHLALLVSWLRLNKKEAENIGRLLMQWATGKKESRIVRVNALQGLFEMAQKHQTLLPVLQQCISSIKKENIPSLNARIKKLLKVQ